MADPAHDDQIARYADMMAALGTETRLRIVIETACGPTRSSAAPIMNDGSTVEVTAITAASPIARGGAVAN